MCRLAPQAFSARITDTNHEHPTLGVGLYSLAEAARLLRTPRRTLSRWAVGYVQPLRGGPKRYASVINPAEDSLTFGDLVELMYVRGFREAGVPLDSLRRTAAKYRADWKEDYPFATEKFATDGKLLLLQEGQEWKDALTGQRTFFENLRRQIIHVEHLASEWRPLGNDRAVVLNPDRSFGKPIEDESGAHTYVLAHALAGGETLESIAWWYGTSATAVNDAVEFEKEWSQAA